MNHSRFSIQRSFAESREALAIIATSLDYRSLFSYQICDEHPIEDTIPIGSIEFCEKLLPEKPVGVVMNFYPQFLKKMIYRNISLVPLGFIKRADRWKGDWTGCYSFYHAEPVCFENEWRFYVANGTVYSVGWYQGILEDSMTPEVPVEWPKSFCGAVDFGLRVDGRVELIEAHAPYACGWYGDCGLHYAQWQAIGWHSLKNYYSRWFFNPTIHGRDIW